MLYLLFSLYIMEQAAIYNKEYLLRIPYRLLSVLRCKCIYFTLQEQIYLLVFFK